MRRLPLNSQRAAQELWRDLEARLETTRRQIGDAPKELMRREVQMYRDTLDLWMRGQLLNADRPLTMDVLVVGFPRDALEAVANHLRGLGLQADFAEDNRAAYAMMQVAHTQLVLWDVRNPSPGAFIRMATERQPHLKSIAVGDANNREVFERMRQNDVSAFIPIATVDTWSERIRPFNQCVLATLARTSKRCPNFEAGRPCLGECANLEPPVSMPSGYLPGMSGNL